MGGRLVAGLAERGLADAVNLVIVSDHGMAATGPDRVVVLDDHLDPDLLEIDALSPVLLARPRAGLADSAYRALRAAPHLRVYRGPELPARFHLASSPRVPPIVAIADEGWEIRRRPEPGERAPVGGGDHGYDDALSSMRAIFLAHGPGFRRGLVVPPFRNVHLYPLLAELLGVRPVATDGSLDSVRALLRGGSATSAPAPRPASPPAPAARGRSSAAPAPR